MIWFYALFCVLLRLTNCIKAALIITYNNSIIYNIMNTSLRDIKSVLFSITVLNLSLSPLIVKVRRRNKRQELLLLLIYYMDKDNDMAGYFFLRDVFGMLGRENYRELAGSLRKSGLIVKVGHMGNYYLTDAGKALARQIDKDIKTEYKTLLKLYRNTTK